MWHEELLKLIIEGSVKRKIIIRICSTDNKEPSWDVIICLNDKKSE